MEKPKKAVRYRSAITGNYVSAEYAQLNPDTTVKESEYVKKEPKK